MKKTKEEVIPLIIEQNYSTFQDFYKNEKPKIYKKIAEIFEDSLRQDNEVKLLVLAKVNGIIFDTTFTISKNSRSLLTDNVIPYFEQTEEYEICGRLLKILSEREKLDNVLKTHYKSQNV